MKRLLYISLLAIAMLSLATPVYAQEGYPIDPTPVQTEEPEQCWITCYLDSGAMAINFGYECSDSSRVERWLNNDYMSCTVTIVGEETTGDNARSSEDANANMVQGVAGPVLENESGELDVPAGGEGPNAAVVIAVSFAALLGISFYLTYRAFWSKH